MSELRSLAPSASRVIVDPTQDGRWEALSRTDGASLFVSPPWLRVIAETYGFEVEAALLVGPGGEPVGGVPYCRLHDAMGERLVSTPFCDFCDPMVTGPRDWPRLIRPLLDTGIPVQLRVTSPRWQDVPELTPSSVDRHHRVVLDCEPEVLWHRLDPAARRNVQRARKLGVEVRFDTSLAGLDAFYALHALTRQVKHGLLAQPRRFFHQIHAQFHPSDGVAVALALLDGRPVAGIVLLEWNGRAYYKFNGSDPAALHARPNDLLMWECLVRSRLRGRDSLDLGLTSGHQDGLARYKRKFAATEASIWTLVAGPHPADHQRELGTALRSLTRLLVDGRVPPDVREGASDALYRYFT